MKKGIITKILMIGMAALLLGSLVFVIGMTIAGWDFSNLSTIVIEQVEHRESADSKVDSIELDFDNARVTVSIGDFDGISVSYPTAFTRDGKAATEVIVTNTDGKLRIKEKNLWRSNIGINLTRPEVTINIPSDRAPSLNLDIDNGDIVVLGSIDTALGALTLNTDNGDINTERVALASTGEIRVGTSNGDVELGRVYCKKLTVETDNGEINLVGGTVDGIVHLDTDNGDIDLEGDLITQSITVGTDNGDLSLSTITAEKIMLNSDRGDIEAKINGNKADYTIKIEKSIGKSNISSSSGGEKTLDVECDLGEIEIYFTEN